MSPGHLAIIVDGNGRWAERRNISRTEGHKAGELLQSIWPLVNPLGGRRIVDIAQHVFNATEVHTLTLFLFSSENWKRPPAEVTNIMNVLQDTFYKLGAFLVENNVRVEVIGQLDRLPQTIVRTLTEIEHQRHLNQKSEPTRTLCLALSYGGRDDIVEVRGVDRVMADYRT